MTQDEILEMAKEAGLEVDGVYFSDHMYRAVLVRFAALVALAEREACAKLCDLFQARDVGMQPAECAGAIRARGEQA